MHEAVTILKKGVFKVYTYGRPYFNLSGAGIACWLEHWALIERLRVRIPAVAAGEFSSPVLTLCADLFGVRSTPVLS